MAVAPTPRTSTLRRLMAVIGVAILLALAVAYINRRTLAREALTGWLQSKGVAAQAEVEGLGFSDFAGRIRIGDPARPDFAAERVAVRYRLGLRGFEVTEVRLTRPVLRASVVGGQLRAGALDPLIQEFLRRPPRPDVAQPDVQVEDGLVLLATDYGPLRFLADARLQEGKLARLSAAVDPARLDLAGHQLSLGRTVIGLVTKGGVVEARLDAPFALTGATALDAARLTAIATLPYPDFVKKRGDGALILRADLAAKRLAVAGQTLSAPRGSFAFSGQAKGWMSDLLVSGRAVADLGAGSAGFGPAHTGILKAAAVSDDLRWSRAGGDRVTAPLRLSGSLEALSAGDLRLQRLAAAFVGPLDAAPGPLALDVSGSVVGRGGWTGLGPVLAADTGDMPAIKRAARDFRLAAPAMTLKIRDGAAGVAFARPLDLIPRTGGRVRLAGTPGDLRLTASGGALPQVDARLRRLSLVPGGVVGDADLKARFALGPIEGGSIETAGRIRFVGGSLTLTAARCAQLAARRLEFGANDLTQASMRLCPEDAPLVRFGNGEWRVVGRVQAVEARSPSLQVRIADGAGAASLGAVGDELGPMVILVNQARREDEAPARRFNPLIVSGRATLLDEAWNSELAFRLPAGRQVATARLRHEPLTGRGGMTIDTENQVFAEGGLQPIQVSPLAAAVGSPVSGQARFTGAFDWTPTSVSSHGEVSIPSLDFQSPAGRVTGLSGKVVLTSLAPLTAAPGQALRIESLAAIVPVTDVTASFGVRDQVLTVSGGEAALGGGRVRIEALEVPLTPGAPMRGVLLFEGVQLHDLVEASPFGDKVELDAKVTGRMPFEVIESRVRVLGGDLKAIQPGRLSIQRSALAGVTAGGATEGAAAVAAAPDASATVADFAYQAMENLAFETLDAQVRSREDGRLGVLFHMIGKHDPPQRQQIRLSLADLISRNFLGKPLPLPSNTGVDLTLDTTLNLDDLLSDYAEYLRLRGSGPVQP